MYVLCSYSNVLIKQEEGFICELFKMEKHAK